MKVYERTENGVTTRVTVREALAEANTAMMEGRRQVKTMSSQHGRHDIAYKDGRHVLLVMVDVEPEPEEWGSAAASMLLHKFQGDGPADGSADYRAKCNRGIRWYARPLSQTEGPRLQTRTELEASKYAHLHTFCPRCDAK
ncbi:hypothetical protein [Streptomyces sp. NRRL F-5123]|uniref:hypothetical protein n=1 Tax=Streptomyces sp. NRRL F-5123 TaxID=1463856 RepID=UPI0004E14C42|nr:hypothetical protein [Streptomyces sp. NRRL F-5123]